MSILITIFHSVVVVVAAATPVVFVVVWIFEELGSRYPWHWSILTLIISKNVFNVETKIYFCNFCMRCENGKYWRIWAKKRHFGLFAENCTFVSLSHNLLQWFPTRVPRYTRVTWASARGAANNYNSLIFIPYKPDRGATR